MGNNLNDRVKQVFEDYRQAYDGIEGDPAIQRARRAIEQYQASLESLEAPYREKMAEAEAEIVASVLVREGSVTLYGVYARYTKGRRSTSWKSVATVMKAPQAVIDEHTTVGEPDVSVTVIED